MCSAGRSGTSERRTGWIEWTLLAVLSVLWDRSVFFVEVALRRPPPFTVVFCRVALAAAALVLLAADRTDAALQMSSSLRSSVSPKRCSAGDFVPA